MLSTLEFTLLHWHGIQCQLIHVLFFVIFSDTFWYFFLNVQISKMTKKRAKYFYAVKKRVLFFTNETIMLTTSFLELFFSNWNLRNEKRTNICPFLKRRFSIWKFESPKVYVFDCIIWNRMFFYVFLEERNARSSKYFFIIYKILNW